MANETETKPEVEVSGLDKYFTDLKTETTGIVKASLADISKELKASFRVDGGPEQKAEVLKPSTEVAKVADFKGPKVMGIEVIPTVGGMFVGVFATELIDGLVVKFMPKATAQTQKYVAGGAKLGIAYGAFWAGKKYGDKIPLIGRFGLNVVALLVAYDGIRTLIPAFDTQAQDLADKLSGTKTTAGLAGNKAQQLGVAKVAAAPGNPPKNADVYAYAQGRK